MYIKNLKKANNNIGAKFLIALIGEWTVSDTEYLLYDGHGSTRQILDSTGITDVHNYDAYGVSLGYDDSVSSPKTNLRYAGEYFDENISNYYLRTRWYSPANGRFNRMDPYAGNNRDPQSLHKYLYCHANPVNSIDPSGMWSLAGTIAVTGIVSSIVGGILIGVGIKVKNDVVRDIGIAFLTMGLALVGAAALMAGGILLLSAAEAVATTLGVFGVTLLITIAGGMVSEYADRTVTTANFKRFLEFYAIDSSRKIPPKGILIFREGHGNITEVEIPNFVFSVRPQYMTNDTIYAYECTNPDSATDFVIKKYKIDSDGALNEKYTIERSVQGLAKVDKNLPVGWTVIE